MDNVNQRVNQLAEDAFGIMRDVLQDAKYPLDAELNLAICETTAAAMKAVKLLEQRTEPEETVEVTVIRFADSSCKTIQVHREDTVIDVISS